MQGRYQLHVLQNASTHAIHEDFPDEISQVISNFVERNTRPIPKPKSFKATAAVKA
jgi:hypothetical protein